MTRGRVNHWLWDTQMRRLPRALVGMVTVAWAATAAGAVLLVVQLEGGAA